MKEAKQIQVTTEPNERTADAVAWQVRFKNTQNWCSKPEWDVDHFSGAEISCILHATEDEDIVA
jgi:hypothetical protein